MSCDAVNNCGVFAETATLLGPDLGKGPFEDDLLGPDRGEGTFWDEVLGRDLGEGPFGDDLLGLDLGEERPGDPPYVDSSTSDGLPLRDIP